MEHNFGSEIKEQLIRDEEEAEMTADKIEDAKERMVDGEIEQIQLENLK